MSASLLEPGITIKPKATKEDVIRIIQEVYGLRYVSMKEINGYDDINYYIQVEKYGDNEYISSVNEHGYILKIINLLDSKKPDIFEAQNQILLYLDKNGICAPKPVKDKSGNYYALEQFPSGTHIVRLLEFIPGSILHQVPPSDNLFYQSGVYVAQLDEVLKKFNHPVYDNHKFIWMMDEVPQLSKFIFAVTDESRKKLIEEVINEFSERVLAVNSQLEKGIIHGDFNEQNIVVELRDSSWHVKAVLDFGDASYGCYLYELAIAMTYMMIQGKSIDAGGHVLGGYYSVRKLPSLELNLLKVCIAARLCQSLVIGAYSILQDPKNSYVLTTAKSGWALLEDLWRRPEKQLLDHWKNIAEIDAE